MKKIIYQAVIFILIFSRYLPAQQQDVWTTFTEADGLAHNFVNTICESSDGAVWFGTYQGVSKFQHGKWTNLAVADTLYITKIIESSDGAMWFGTQGEGVCRYHQGIWTTFTITDGWMENYVQAIIEASDGAMWFGTQNGVIRYQQGIWTTFTTMDGLVNNYVNSICESSDNSLWFGTDEGVSRYKNGNWTNFAFTDTLHINVIVESSDGALWFGTRGDGVIRYHQGIWKILTAADTLIAYSITAIMESSDEAMWFGTSEGAMRYQQGILTTFTVADGLVDDGIRAIMESSDGAIWFGTWEGVTRYQQANWRTFNTDDGLADNLITAIIESSDGALWFGTWYGGVSCYKQGSWTTFTKSDGLVRDDVRTIVESSDGALWFGTYGGGISRYYQGIWTTFTSDDGLVNNHVTVSFKSSDGALWFGAFGGVSRLHQGVWTNYTMVDGLVDYRVFAIYESSDGAMWFGTYGGISRYHQGNWQNFTISDGLSANDVQAIMEASDGAIWIGTYGGGVNRYQQGNWTTFTTDDGLSNNDVSSIIESSDGALWIGTCWGGVNRYKQGNWIKFTTADGLANSSITAIIESSDGTLWFGTGAGVSRLKPDKLPPVTYIVEGPDDLVGTPTPLFIVGANDNHTKKEDLLYSYSVAERPDDGFFNFNLLSWSPFSNNTVIQTKLLPNGSHTFFVRAKDLWGNVDPIPASWNFKVDITQPTTTIEYPKSDDVISGIIAIKGTVYDDSPIKDFKYYSVYFGKGPDTNSINKWDTLVSEANQEILDDTLAIWNTTGLRGTYQLKLFAKDSLGHENEDVITVHIVDVTGEIKSQQGGYVSDFQNNIKLYFPPNSLIDNTKIQIEFVTDLIPDSVNTELYKYAGLAYDILPDTFTLGKKPATIVMAYTDSNLFQVSDEKKLSIFRYDKTTNTWQHIGGTLDMGNRKITTSISQLGRYGLFENLSEGIDFFLSDVNCQPRIFSPKGGGHDIQTAISFELGKESGVTIKIYNASGRLVRALSENKPMSHGNNVVYWDGKDQQGEFCVSGLYIVTIQAEEKMATKTVVVLNK